MLTVGWIIERTSAATRVIELTTTAERMTCVIGLWFCLTDRRSAASALTAMLHHGATPPDGKSRWRAKRAKAAVPRERYGARQLERLVERRVY